MLVCVRAPAQVAAVVYMCARALLDKTTALPVSRAAPAEKKDSARLLAGLAAELALQAQARAALHAADASVVHQEAAIVAEAGAEHRDGLVVESIAVAAHCARLLLWLRRR